MFAINLSSRNVNANQVIMNVNRCPVVKSSSKFPTDYETQSLWFFGRHPKRHSRKQRENKKWSPKWSIFCQVLCQKKSFWLTGRKSCLCKQAQEKRNLSNLEKLLLVIFHLLKVMLKGGSGLTHPVGHVFVPQVNGNAASLYLEIILSSCCLYLSFENTTKLSENHALIARLETKRGQDGLHAPQKA